MKKILTALFAFYGLAASAQDITMEFPHLAGKTYDFILFQGDTPVVKADTVPANGKFVLSVPQQYRPYTGMCRWLITNTQEGGGLDMVIPGHDFSVTCTDPQPTDASIIYTNNNGPATLNRLYLGQQAIIDRYFAIEQVMKVYPKDDKALKFFGKEKEKHIHDYDDFLKKMAKESKYVAAFINIVNITMGNANRLGISDSEKPRYITEYISSQLDWDILYTSGHWGGIIGAWIDIHTEILKDDALMAKQTEAITKKLSPLLLKDFTEKAAYYRNRKKEF